jgi:hypothetical protein
MNACLNELLQLTPHEVPESQRRIEKTEIIEMAIKHMRNLISLLESKCKIKILFSLIFILNFSFLLAKNPDANIDSYRTGYRNGLSDIFEFLDEYSDSEQLLNDLTQYFKEKEINLKSLTG